MTAISIAAEDKTIIVVGQDIDLLVLLNQLNEKNLDILFQKPLTGNTPNCFYSSNSYEDESKRKYVAFIHCFTGCDTTSGCAGKVTTEKLIPDNLLKAIFCSCEKGCLYAKCSCRKHGLRCTDLCSNCNELGNSY
uniref:Tesmin/TSO1-like CXC domain-containing protein n=1 Tax=Homalodisca liturata TaxID=320908 RepID=A0A1B6I9D2_9HEMI